MKYIPADKLIAEIERRIIEHRKSLKKDITLISEAMLKGSLGAYESIEHFIAFLQQEQPKVDFETEYAKFSNDTDALDYAFPIDLADYKDFARHFYELGLKVRKV